MELEITVHDSQYGSHNRNKTHCRKGHPLSGDNVYAYRGHRYCKQCRAESNPVKSKSGIKTTYTHGRFRTHCKRGHPMAGDNLYVKPSGVRCCKTCRADRLAKNPVSKEYANAIQRRYRERHPDRVKACLRRAQIKRKGITLEQHAEMLAAQNGLCAICKNPPPSHRSLDVDHCHTTNKVRGLLCSPCNVALGHFRDNIALLNEAQIYLWKSGGGNLNHMKINE